MKVISVGVRPGATRRMSWSKVNASINLARKYWSECCNISMPGSSTPTLYIFIVSPQWAHQTFSLPPVWNAFAHGRGIYLNYDGTADTIKRLGMEILHEMLHTWGYSNAPAMPHNDHTRWCVMYPSGSSSGYFCPEEVLYLQRKYGKPRSNFVVPVVSRAKYVEKKRLEKYRSTRKDVDLKKYYKARNRRISLQYQWRKVPKAVV